MTLWTFPHRLVLELYAPDLELVIDLGPQGCVRAWWIDSQTGAALAAVPVARA